MNRRIFVTEVHRFADAGFPSVMNSYHEGLV